jgi:hypothetical protein
VPATGEEEDSHDRLSGGETGTGVLPIWNTKKRSTCYSLYNTFSKSQKIYICKLLYVYYK